LGAFLVPNVRANEWDKKTIVTFNQPVQVPGTVLPAGTYVFKLTDGDSNRNIVEILNGESTYLVATIMAIPDYHMKTPDKTMMSFDERPSGQPEALWAWFYRGDAVLQRQLHISSSLLMPASEEGQSWQCSAQTVQPKWAYRLPIEGARANSNPLCPVPL
jgi:hypothetical protein